MKIGVCAKDLHGDYPSQLRWLAEHGFDGFQTWKRDMDNSKVTAKDVLAMANDLGLEVSAVGGGPNLVNPEKTSQTIDLYRTFLDLSVELGPCLVTGEDKGKPRALCDDDAWSSCVQTVATICQHAETVGAVLAIECAGGCLINDHHAWVRLADRVGSPALKVNYDPANIVWAGSDVIEGVNLVGDHIVHTHAKDIQRVPSKDEQVQEHAIDVPVGQGLVGFDAYLGALRQVGFNGYLTIEMHAGKHDRAAEMLESATYLRNWLAA